MISDGREHTMSWLLAAAKPAGGAAIDQVIIATAGAALATAIVYWLVRQHRAGGTGALTRVSAFAERVSGIPGWAALPNAVGGVSLIVALLGMYWDIALHINQGRDEGPLANPAHYLILAGLYGVFVAGILSLALPRRGERPGPAAVRISHDWYAPVGGLLMAAAGAFALTGFPLDDVWHRLFGQDVTLWGPTHLMLIGGAGMTLVGQAVLLVEGMRARERAGHTGNPPLVVYLRRMGIVGGFLIGLSTFQAEFDFGVPQFQQVFQPFLIALAAGVALVAGRVWIGPGGAIAAAVFFLVVRGGVSLIVGGVFGEGYPSLPLYLPEAIVVELAALALARRPLALGAVAGVLIATAGYAGEHVWTQVAMPLPWNGELLPEGVALALVGGVGGGLVGALLGGGLRGELPSVGVARAIPAAATLGIVGALVYGLVTETPPVRAQLTIAGDGNAVVRVEPRAAAEHAKWLSVTAWQGGGLHVDRLERSGPASFRTTEPMPLSGEWKTILRLHTGTAVLGVPIRLPADEAIPAAEVAPSAEARPFVRDTEILQRERKDDVAGWLWAAAGAVVALLYLAFLGALAWGVGRVGRACGREPGGTAPAAPTASPPAGRRGVAVGA
jgi:hypothetical protein